MTATGPVRRRILLLLPFAPRHDAAHGGARLMAEQVEALSTHHDLALLCLRAADDPPTEQRLRRCCEVVEEVVRFTTVDSTLRRTARSARLLLALVRGEPMWVADWAERTYAHRVRTLARTWRPDVVQIEYHVMGQYLPALENCRSPRLLVAYEPGYAAARERWRIARGPLRWARALDAHAWERFERTLLGRVNAIVAFTERDVRALTELSRRTIVRIRPGMPLPTRPLHALGTAPLDMLFVGNFVHPPNRDAALRLATTIHPRLRARFPALRLHLVGDHPPRALQALASEHVVVTGRVPDVTPFLDRTAVVVAPLRQGGGIRVKVLEALAAGKAVVASPLAVEGLEVVSGAHCLVADTDDEIAAAVSNLLDDPALRARLGGAARAWAAANLGWPRAVAAYDALYDRLLDTAHHRDAAESDQTLPAGVAARPVCV
ncbi:MAG: glycosyltransferase [Deltaproteobacteria bacterium]|nr:glycosyltransferase [Deltaproteobacteria bacterium]